MIPYRIQNLSSLISLLVDVYESDPEHSLVYLDYANNMAERLLDAQASDGAYYAGRTHYTCVIYVAKSMLELALCEKQLASNPIYLERYQKHYDSARKAADNLLLLLETIGTEGEHTFEDGMISCSALQIAYFALTLDENARKPYIEGAEYMLSIHRCLEQNVVPDARMHGATLRFWEAQYDVMVKGNMLNSPHGWTSWKSYATYYLYLLTGKASYLIETINTLGACIQTIDDSGKLRWAFIVDPIRTVKALVPDYDKESPDAYPSSTALGHKSYRGKYETRHIGEQYVDMISSWYRPGPDAPMNGAYDGCPLILDGYSIDVDTQGGACDNDVHEHFKCFEETLLGKGFIILNEVQALSAYNCIASLGSDGVISIELQEYCHTLHFNLAADTQVRINDEIRTVKAGLSFLSLSV